MSSSANLMRSESSREGSSTTTVSMVTPRLVSPPGATDPGTEADFNGRVDDACGRLAFLLRRVAARFARRLPNHIELDDLVGAGSVGLVTAVRQHIDKPAIELRRLAEQRIRGSILDYLRSIDHLTRRQRAAVTAAGRARATIRARGERANTTEVARVMGVTVERARMIEGRLGAVTVTSFESDSELPSEAPDPSEMAIHYQTKIHMVAALAQLPKRLQNLLSLYYCESLTYQEIGEILGISRSRICQLHTQAIQALRCSMDRSLAA